MVGRALPSEDLPSASPGTDQQFSFSEALPGGGGGEGCGLTPECLAPPPPPPPHPPTPTPPTPAPRGEKPCCSPVSGRSLNNKNSKQTK